LDLAFDSVRFGSIRPRVETQSVSSITIILGMDDDDDDYY